MVDGTTLVFQRDGFLYQLETTVSVVYRCADLSESQRSLFRSSSLDSFVVTLPATIFHPQGGGQPADTGSIVCPESGVTFHVTDVRADSEGVVLHLGTFSPAESDSFQASQTVVLSIDVEKRELYSRFHTAGHVLGAAVRHLLETSVPDFDELKASHFPDSAACEFQGLIAGSHKDAIQAKVDEYVQRDMPVEIEWWDEDDFRREGLERLIPDRKAMGLADEEKFRVVKIVGAEVYPCGGTHVRSTKACEKTVVKGIKRQKGVSRVSYLVR